MAQGSMMIKERVALLTKNGRVDVLLGLMTMLTTYDYIKCLDILDVCHSVVFYCFIAIQKFICVVKQWV